MTTHTIRTTVAALAAGIVLGSTGVGIAATQGLIHIGYNVACSKSTSHSVACVAKGDHANLAVAISTKMVLVVDTKNGSVLFFKTQR